MEIENNLQETTVKWMKPRVKSMIWNIKKQKTTNQNNKTLASMVQWIEHQIANQRGASSIPSQGTSLGCGPGPQQGVFERQPHIDVSLPLFLLPFPSL